MQFKDPYLLILCIEAFLPLHLPHRQKIPSEHISLHAGKGSFDFVGASLREAPSSLRMTRLLRRQFLGFAFVPHHLESALSFFVCR